MSRISIVQDVPAQICWKYLHNELSKTEKREVRSIVSIAIPNRRKVNQFIWEIAYRIGYAKSKFASSMSEVTYKKKKQWIRNLIQHEIAERNKK